MKNGQAEAGTQERKRHRKAAPSPSQGYGIGCATQLLLAIGVCWLFGRIVPSSRYLVGAIGVLLAIGLAMLLHSVIWQMRLLNEVRLRWTSRGIRCLLVHSRSPNWESHVTARWLPRFGHLAETLDWTERAGWERTSLAVRVFEIYCGSHDFNPCVVVFRGLQQPLVFRFYEAFHQAKHGRTQYLEELESKLYAALEV